MGYIEWAIGHNADFISHRTYTPLSVQGVQYTSVFRQSLGIKQLSFVQLCQKIEWKYSY